MDTNEQTLSKLAADNARLARELSEANAAIRHADRRMGSHAGDDWQMMPAVRAAHQEVEGMSDELKPCPFCGADAEYEGPDDLPMIGCQTGCAVNPAVCIHTDDAENNDPARHVTLAWNTRPIEDALRAEIAALKKVVRAADAVIEAEWMVSHDWGGDRDSVLAAYDAARAKVTV